MELLYETLIQEYKFTSKEEMDMCIELMENRGWRCESGNYTELIGRFSKVTK